MPRTRLRITSLWPSERLRREALQAFRRAPLLLQIVVGLALVLMLWLALNGVYQIVRKPSELFFPVSGTLNKTPTETWRQYAPLFLKYSTDVMTPELLAALAQVEASGNPVARTYWRWASAKPARLERRRHVPDHRWHLCRGAALLHQASQGGGGRALE
jgi:hypothetical protein